VSAEDVVIGLVAGVIAGILAVVTGTGGGFFTVPVMVIVLDRAQTIAQGTSLLAIVVMAAMGTWGSASRRTMPWKVIRTVAVGGVIGASTGAVLALRVLEEGQLRRIFGAFLMLTALRIAWGGRPRKVIAEEQP
jgi:uncharacterized membrane protein YfcA